MTECGTPPDRFALLSRSRTKSAKSDHFRPVPPARGMTGLRFPGAQRPCLGYKPQAMISRDLNETSHHSPTCRTFHELPPCLACCFSALQSACAFLISPKATIAANQRGQLLSPKSLISAISANSDPKHFRGRRRVLSSSIFSRKRKAAKPLISPMQLIARL